MLTALILACTLTTPDCTPSTAVYVARVPVASALPYACLAAGQEHLAQARGLDLTGLRVAIKCETQRHRLEVSR